MEVRRLFSGEDELLIECVGRLNLVVLQVGSPDQWIWHLHVVIQLAALTTI